MEKVIPEYESMEDRFFASMAKTEAAAAQKFTEDPDAALKLLTDLTDQMACEAMETALSMGRYIKGKFLCNTVLSWL